jgi:hypothetical protein
MTDSASSGIAASAPIGSSALCSIRLDVARALRSPIRFGLSDASDLVESFSKQIALTPRSGQLVAQPIVVVVDPGETHPLLVE